MGGMAVWLVGFALGATLVEDAANMDLKNRPVSKVIKLLHDMKAELEADAANDQSVYDKLVCWCETNEKDKTTATGNANKQIDSLLSDIERLTAKGAQLKTEIAQAEKEKAANEKALKEATAVREKESAEFNTDEKDMFSPCRP
jgi:septal ring factor EnvC (AmiA/AmiB activator)